MRFFLVTSILVGLLVACGTSNAPGDGGNPDCCPRGGSCAGGGSKKNNPSCTPFACDCLQVTGMTIDADGCAVDTYVSTYPNCGNMVKDSGTDTMSMEAGAFTLTSSALVPGAMFAPDNTCKGKNESPPLAWTSAPNNTLSFAMTLTDKSNNLVHWVMWDIPSNASALPASVAKVATPPMPPGSKQAISYDNSTYGYLGPCPPMLHTYTFEVYALDIAMLPNVTTMSTRTQVVTELGKHKIASATLTGQFAP